MPVPASGTQHRLSSSPSRLPTKTFDEFVSLRQSQRLSNSFGALNQEDVKEEEEEQEEEKCVRDMYGFAVDPVHVEALVQWAEKEVPAGEKRSRAISAFFDTKNRRKMLTEAQLTDLCEAGIPRNYRGQCWSAFLRADQQLQMFKGYYRRLGEQTEADERELKAFAQIDKDLSRTFPDLHCDHAKFESRLRRLTCAYARHNPTIGYAQGMNFIAGTLLLFMKEECAFWAFKTLVEDRMPNYFIDDLRGVNIDNKVFQIFVNIYLRRLSNHFKKMGFKLPLITTEWFMCLYVKNLPSETAFRIWDAFLYDGVSAVFEYGIRILKRMEKTLLTYESLEQMAEMVEYIKTTMAGMFDFERLRRIPIEPPIKNGNIEMWRETLNIRAEKRIKSNKYLY